jgi:hypothetical protein
MVTIITYPYQHRGPLHIKPKELRNIALHIYIEPGELLDSFYAMVVSQQKLKGKKGMT